MQHSLAYSYSNLCFRQVMNFKSFLPKSAQKRVPDEKDLIQSILQSYWLKEKNVLLYVK